MPSPRTTAVLADGVRSEDSCDVAAVDVAAAVVVVVEA